MCDYGAERSAVLACSNVSIQHMRLDIEFQLELFEHLYNISFSRNFLQRKQTERWRALEFFDFSEGKKAEKIIFGEKSREKLQKKLRWMW